MIILILLVLHNKMAMASIDLSSGRPVPHADILHSILAANVLNYTDTPDGSLFNYLFSTKGTNNSYNTENLDINVLDVDNVKKIVAVAKRKYSENQEFRRKRESLKFHPHLIELALRQMQQSIYSTRDRIWSTAAIRKQFHGVHSYNIALLCGSLNQILLKMENLYAQMRRLPGKTHFIWHLIIYEKILAGHVDVTYMAKKMFELHAAHLKKFNSS